MLQRGFLQLLLLLSASPPNLFLFILRSQSWWLIVYLIWVLFLWYVSLNMYCLEIFWQVRNFFFERAEREPRN